MKWTPKRLKQLDDLRQLLVEVATINRGSHVIERLQRCIPLAESLHRTDLSDKDEPHDFHQFLTILASRDGDQQP